MKPPNLILAVFPVLAMAHPALAAVQAMALGPQNIALGARDSADAVQFAGTYCLEAQLDIPDEDDRLTQVLAGDAYACSTLYSNRCVPLQTALEHGDIEITGTDDFSLQFRNQRDVAISVEFRGNSVLSDHRAGLTAPTRILPIHHDWAVQEALWKAAETAEAQRIGVTRIESIDPGVEMFALRPGALAELGSRIDSIAARLTAPRTIVLLAPSLAGQADRLASDLQPLFDEFRTLNEAAIIHSDNGRRLVVMQKIDDRSIAVITNARDAAAALIDHLPSNVTLVRSGRAPVLDLAVPRFTLQRSFSAPTRLAESFAHVVAPREVKPSVVVNGVPKTIEQHDAQGLLRTKFPAYQQLANRIDALANKLGRPLVTTKSDLLALLQNGEEDFAIVVAHSDGTRLYIGGEVISLRELEAMPQRTTPARRTIILAVCRAGQTATRIGELQGFAQLFIAKGFALSVVAPTKTIDGLDVEKLINALGSDTKALLRSLGKIACGWILIGSNDAPAAARRATEA